MHSISVYRGTRRITIIEASSPSSAWKAARSYVRSLVQSGGDWSTTPGRLAYEAGIFRAVDTYRAK